MSKKIIIYGNASKKVIKTLKLEKELFKCDLLTLLRNNNIPIASSCDGEGICEKCMINKNIISCQINLEEFINKFGNTIDVAYL